MNHGEMLTAIWDTVQEIAMTMLMVEIAPVSPKSLTFNEPYVPSSADTVALIRMQSGLQGGIRLCSNRASCLALAGVLFGGSFDTLTEDASDSYCELANMVAGGVQTILSDQYDSLKITPPELFTRDHPEPGYPGYYHSVHYSFVMDGNPFFVETFFKEGSEE
ncbi:MAG: chemotaxis protein CheX [Magnetococcales bacterium]|nr:chemotaxis protein CheX [Magnetococcales bacterium]